jgi:hypothetical protein
MIEQENCCTSCTIPTSLAIYRAGKKHLLGDGPMIYDWCFVGEGTQVALSTATVHGMTSRHFALYDTRSRRLLQKWERNIHHPMYSLLEPYLLRWQRIFQSSGLTR